VLANGARCTPCAAILERRRTRSKRARRPYLNVERERRAAAVAEWVAEHGWWCPGWTVPPHESEDLTADHVEAVAAGGAEDGPLGVLCRTCNGRKGAR
jgi:5-methylcytosine-specific restriction protein A